MYPMPEKIRTFSILFVVVSAVIIIWLEKKYPYTKNQKFFRDGFWDDFVFYTFIQSFALGLIISELIIYLYTTSEFSRLQIISGIPVWAQFLFFLVTHDLYIYWFHRWQHNSPLLWRIHEAHHSNKQIDWIAGMRSHPFEILINQTIEFAPIVLLGANPVVALLKGAVDAVWGMYIHSNIDVKSGKLQYFINGPEMHRWHHSDEDDAHNKNFATKLAIWDWLFRTPYLPSLRKPSVYGLSDSSFPSGYIKQVIYAFRKTNL